MKESGQRIFNSLKQKYGKHRMMQMRLGQLKYLPQKIDRANDAVENNKVSMCEVFVLLRFFSEKDLHNSKSGSCFFTLQFDQQAVLHAMRLHFEQIRLAAMLEHKSMEAQLRKLASHMNKTQRRIDAIEERENRLKEEVSAQVRGIWDPKVQKVQKRLDETLEKVRLRVSARMARVEAEVKEKVNASFSDLLSNFKMDLSRHNLRWSASMPSLRINPRGKEGTCKSREYCWKNFLRMLRRPRPKRRQMQRRASH